LLDRVVVERFPLRRGHLCPGNRAGQELVARVPYEREEGVVGLPNIADKIANQDAENAGLGQAREAEHGLVGLPALFVELEILCIQILLRNNGEGAIDEALHREQ
jgi:hypothetical protein